MKNTKQLIGITALSLLAACGGGGGSTNSDDGSEGKSQETQIGVFLDSPVINVDYQTETRSGVTNSSGQYEYIPGETVTFSIGDLKFPVTRAQSTVTPIDIANAQDASDATVLNMIRLLQTLDADGNPANGITITDAAKAAATQVDFTSLEFESLSAVTNLISNAGQYTATQDLVSSQDALAHFESELEKNGLFEAQYYQVKLDLPDGYSALSKVTLADGNITFEELYTSTTDALETGSTSYSIASDGLLAISGESTGVSSSNRAVMMGVDTNVADGDVGISIFTKIDSSVTNSSLNGKFYCASLDSEPYSTIYEIVLDGNGSGTQTLIRDSDGDSGTLTSFNYSVSQGMLSITGNNNSLKGGIANNATVLSLVQYDINSDTGITVCVKSSSTLSDSTINGDYYGGTLDSEPYTAFNTYNFDGAGNAVYSELSISAGTPDTGEEVGYSVNSGGRIIIAGSIFGAVSPDGGVVIYTKVGAGDDLALGLLIKKL